MSKLTIPKGYKSVLSLYDTQTAIGKVNRNFEDNLSNALNLKRVSAPLFVLANTGINDKIPVSVWDNGTILGCNAAEIELL